MSGRAESDGEPAGAPTPKPEPLPWLDPTELVQRHRASKALAGVAVAGVFAGTSAAAQIIARTLDRSGVSGSGLPTWLAVACIAAVLVPGVLWVAPFLRPNAVLDRQGPLPSVGNVVARSMVVLLVLSLPAIWYFGHAMYRRLVAGIPLHPIDWYSAVVVGLVASSFIGFGLVWAIYGRVEVWD